MYKLLTAIGVTLLLVVAVCFSLRRNTYIDTNSGRKMIEITLLGFCLCRETAETDFSKFWMEHYKAKPGSVWQKESETSLLLGGGSPHYGYHGAFLWQQMVIAGVDIRGLNEEQKAVVLSNYVEKLKVNPLQAEKYAREVLNDASK